MARKIIWSPRSAGEVENTYEITGLVINWQNAYALEYSIKVSEDNSEWTEAAYIDDGAYETRFIDISSVEARYIKIEGVKRGTSYGYSIWELEVYGNDIQNQPPSSLTLSSATVFENQPAGTKVGELSVTDPNAGDTHTFTLDPALADNAKFQLNGNILETAESFSYDTDPSFNITVTAQENNTTEQYSIDRDFTIAVYSGTDFDMPITAFAIYGHDDVLIKQDVIIEQGAVGSGGDVEIQDNSGAKGDIVSGGDIQLGAGSSITGDVIAAGSINISGQADISGSQMSGAPPFSKTIETRDVTPGTQDLSVSAGDTLHIAPGQYQDLMAYSNSFVSLVPGEYHFREFKTEPEVEIIADLSSGGTIHLNVSEDLDLRDRAEINVTGTDDASPYSIDIYTAQTSTVDIHPYDDIAGILTAPNAAVHIHPYTKFTGIIRAKSATVEPGAVFDRTPQGDSDGDGIQDIVEMHPEFRTNPLDPRSYPAIAKIDKAVVENADVSTTIHYNYENFGGFSKRKEHTCNI